MGANSSSSNQPKASRFNSQKNQPNESMTNETNKLIQELADRLGTTVEYLWGVLIQQAPIDACTKLTAILLLALALVVMAVYAYRKTWSDEDSKDQVIAVVLVLAGMVGMITFLVSLGSIPSIISGLFNPEYWALKQILP